MILEQYYLGCLSHASYLIGDPESKVAVVIDPQRDIDHYLDEAGRRGLTIRHVVLTHFHADFISGHLELQDRTGAEIRLGAKATAEYPFTPVSDGDTLSLGAVTLRFLETPGHTPEGICVVAHETPDGPPHAIFTGDTLFIGDVGRPDLMIEVGMTAESLGGMLYDSLHEKILPLPESVLIYPAHGAGSMCGKNLSKERFASLGDQKQTNPMLAPMDRDEFVRRVCEEQPEAPAYFAYNADLNRRDRDVLHETLKRVLKPVTVEEMQELVEAGGVVLDVREADAYAAGHVRGSVNIGLEGSFASWAGTLLDPEAPIVIVAEPGREREAATRLGRIGYDHVAGYLDGGMEAVRDRQELTWTFVRCRARDLAQDLVSEYPPLVLDVRSRAEHAHDKVRGSIHVPLGELTDHLRELPRHRRIVTLCHSGYRSAIAVSLIERFGRDDVTDLIGGIVAWHDRYSEARI